jgi:hypothetical protein
VDVELLREAEPVGPGHADRLGRAFAAADKRLWCYFAPFIGCYSLPPGREVLLFRHEGSLWLLVRRRRDEEDQVDLLVPPLPMPVAGLGGALDALLAYNQGRHPRILWVDEADAARIPRDRFRLEPKDREYLYDPRVVAAASGRPFRDLRKRVSRFRRSHMPEFRELAPSDGRACEQLLRHWRRRQGRKHGFLLDWGYTRAAVERYGPWSREGLQGWCVELDGRVAAFGMAGRMQEEVASFFIAKADPDVWGLSEYLRWEIYRCLSKFQLVNDAGDLGLPGLRQHKMKFRPVAYLTAYAAEAV